MLLGLTVATSYLILDKQAHTSSVPTTVSMAWHQVLQRRASAAPETFPEPTDFDGWRIRQSKSEQAGLTESQSIVEQYQPTLVSRKLGDVPVLDIQPRDWQDDGRTLVYTHGGCYATLSARSSLRGSVPIATVTRTRVISVDYTLAPFAKWDEITDQVVSVVEALLANGYHMENIVLYGDSAGGGLAAGAVLKLRDRGIGMPAALFLWSPWSDVTGTGDTYASLADFDPLLVYSGQLDKCAAAYADPSAQRNPYVSPVYGDFDQGFPPTLIQAGTRELFLSDAVRFYRALDQARVPVVLDVYEGMPHTFQVVGSNSPEAQAAFARVKRFLSDQEGTNDVQSQESR